MTTDEDRRGVGLTPDAQRWGAEIQQAGWFADLQDVARFCFAYAVRAGVPLGSTSGTDTRWSISGFDRAGEMQDLVLALYPECVAPVKAIEHFVNEGVRLVHGRVAQFDSPVDIMETR